MLKADSSVLLRSGEQRALQKYSSVEMVSGAESVKQCHACEAHG